MSKRRMGGGGSRGRRIGPTMQAPLPPRRTPVVPETRRKPPRGMAQGGMMKKKGYAAGGLKNGMMEKKSKFPDLSGDGKVTQKDILMGKGVVKKKNGGMMKKKGYANGGMMKKKGYAKGGKVRGSGIATKGVRKAKMVTMKGS